MVVPSPGEQVEDDVAGVGDASLASGVVEVTVEVGEGWEAESGASDAPDDVWGFEGLRGIPVVGDSFGDAAETDGGEFGGEPALEGVDAAAELGDGHGVASNGEFSHRCTGWEIGMGWWRFWGFPLISGHFRSFE